MPSKSIDFETKESKVKKRKAKERKEKERAVFSDRRPSLVRRCIIALFFFYLISCSNASNSGVLKNSPKVISNPSHNSLIVKILGFKLFP